MSEWLIANNIYLIIFKSGSDLVLLPNAPFSTASSGLDSTGRTILCDLIKQNV